MDVSRQAFITESLQCPRTGSRLRINPEYLESEIGGYRYPIIEGIIDFRVFDPPYMSRAEEAILARTLAEAGNAMSHEELVRFYEAGCQTPPENGSDPSVGNSFLLGLRERAPRRLAEMLYQAECTVPAGGTVLDLGCGSCEAIATLKQEGAKQLVGLDISLIELVLGQKLLAEQGVDAILVAGCAEALPFRDNLFDFIYSPDVIEHVSNQASYLQQAHRVLKLGGSVLLNSPNRFSVVCPEPHVGIWFLTFLPRAMVDPVTRLLGKGPYIGKRLVSLGELRRLVSRQYREYKILSRKSNPAAQSLAGRLFHWLRPWSERLFAYVADQHLVQAWK